MLCLHDSIRDDDPGVQRLLCTLEEAPTLPELVLAAWSLARVLASHLVEAVLAERARRPTLWPRCPQCGAGMRRKGFVKRQSISLLGPLPWQRRVGRGPQGCETPQGAPLDDDLGVHPHQRPSGALPQLGWALAVFVPFATAATLLGWARGVAVSPRAGWAWVQAAGRRARAPLHAQLQAAAEGHLPPEEPLAAAVATMPLALGADGVMVPFRPAGGQPRGTTAWHAVKGGVLARLGCHTTRTGTIVARLHQRRLVAVCGDSAALQRRLWLEALRQGIMGAPQGVWLSDGARGLWRLFEERFTASAIGGLDFYHVVQQLWKRAAAWLDGRTPQARRWFGGARHRLRHGHPDGVLAALADALDVEGLPETARETLRTV
jgi:hypothetical protein